MQVTEQQYGELEKVYTMIGAVVLALALKPHGCALLHSFVKNWPERKSSRRA